MNKTTHHYTVRLPHELYSQLVAEAKRQDRAHAELTRLAIEQFLIGHQRLRESDARLRRVCEYAQLALDAILQENHPEFRDPILLEVDKRMERFHGAR